MSVSREMKKRLYRYMCIVLLVMLLPLALGCYGCFPLTHAVYRINGQVENKVVRAVVFWVLVIIPVYKVAMFADAVVLNLIEFWTGTTINISAVHERDGIRTVFQSSEDGREAVLTVTRNGKLLTEQHMVKVSDTVFEMCDASGKLTGKILKTPAGSIHLVDAQGRIIRTLTIDDLAAMPRDMTGSTGYVFSGISGEETEGLVF